MEHTPAFLPGEAHGQRSLVGYSLWGCKEPDMTEPLTFQTSELIINNSNTIWQKSTQHGKAIILQLKKKKQNCSVQFSSVTQLYLTVCDPMDCSLLGSSVHGDSPGKNTGVGCHLILQGIFLTQGLNLDLLHCRQILYHLQIFK